MKRFRSRIILLLISLFTISFFSVTMSFAEEVKGKRFGTFEAKESIKVGDAEGHALAVGVGKGVDVTNSSVFVTSSLSDLTNGNGTHQGYTVTTYKNGSKTFSDFQGKITTAMSPKGIPLVSFEGTWVFTGGTGEWANIQGKGTYKGKFIGPGIYTYDMEGEYSIKK